MLYIAWPWFCIHRLNVLTKYLIDNFNQPVNGYPPAACYIEHTCFIRVACQDIGINHMPDKTEIPALLPVSVDDRLFIFQYGFYKPGHDGGILGFWILPGSEYIEIS